MIVCTQIEIPQLIIVISSFSGGHSHWFCRTEQEGESDYITPTINEAFDKTTARKNNSCSVHSSESRVIVLLCRQIDFLRVQLLLMLIPGQ